MKKKIFLVIVFYTINILCRAQDYRVFKNDYLTEIQKFYPSDYDLFRPVIFALSKFKNEFIVYDYSQNNLYSINKEKGSRGLLSEIGQGRGSGPKEFRNPTDICITNYKKEQSIIVSDSDLARISIWDLDSKVLIKSFKTKRFVPYRLSCYENRIIVYNNSGSKDGNYLIYNTDGQLLKGIKDNTLSKDGFLDSGYIVADSSFIYFGSEGKSEIKRYDYLHETPVQVSSTIEKIESENKLNISKSDEEIRTKRDNDFKYQTRGIGLFNDKLIVFHSGRKDAHGNVIDFYNKKNLEYEFSVEISNVFSSIDIQENRLLINAYDFDKKEREFYVYEIKSD